MSRYFVILLLLPFAHNVHGEEVACVGEGKNMFWMLQIAASKQTDQEKLYEAAMIYTHKSMKEEERVKWTRKWEGDLKDNLKDQVEEVYTRDYMFTFCSDNKEHFKNPVNVPREKIVKLCMLYLRMYDRHYALPEKVIEKLTSENTSKVIKFLTEQAEVK